MRATAQILLLRNLFLVLLVGTPYVQGVLYVPAVQQTSYELIPAENQYQLRITLPDGSTRYETVELRGEGTPEQELHVMGTVENQFQSPHSGKSVTIYEAGKNGYVVKYKYEGLPQPMISARPEVIVLSINAGGLKSAAG